MTDLKPRQWEIARTLVQLAKLVGNEAAIRKSITALYAKSRAQEDSLEVRILKTLAGMFEAKGPKVTGDQLLAKLASEGMDLRNGKAVAAKLYGFGVQPKVIRVPGGTARGYTEADCADAIKRYC